MKTWMAAVLAAAAVVLPRLGSPGTELGSLKPVELVHVIVGEEFTELRTDTGDYGIGKDLPEAVEDLERSCPGRIFLDTADFLLVWGELKQEELTELFRPACGICRAEPGTDPEEAAVFLRAHPPRRTLGDLRAGMQETQKLVLEEGRGTYAAISDEQQSDAGVAGSGNAGSAGTRFGSGMGVNGAGSSGLPSNFGSSGKF